MAQARPLPIDFFLEIDQKEKAGVYKLTFSNGEFYIGSTINFKNRVSAMKTEMRDGYAHSKRMKNAVSESISVVFEVLEYVVSHSDIKVREDFYIKLVFGDPMLINRSSSAFSNKGIRWSAEEKEKVRKSTKGICYRWKNRKPPVNIGDQSDSNSNYIR